MWLAVVLSGATEFMSPSTAADGDVSYLRDIKPLLAAKCTACHGVLKQEAGLRLDAAELVRRGGDAGSVISAGQDGAGSGALLDRVASADVEHRMPPKGEGEPLKPEQVDLLRRWIETGAHGPADEVIAESPADHWAFRAPERPEIPATATAPSADPIDALLEMGRAAAGVTAAPPADPATLLRRVHFDLVGLPPTREELQRFLADPSDEAYQRIVDELLARPAFGERWARRWMDVWRYSDWDGFGAELRGSQKHIWRWRDWIVESLNADKPYDAMILEMLAGDELAPTDPDVLRATGFLARNYYKFNRHMWLDNVVEHTGKAFLGLTINCAKCHDHKYDPIAHRDYYALRAVFEPYNVRVDRRPGQLDVDLDGTCRVFDAEPDAATPLLVRGDERLADTSQPILPAIPAVFGVLPPPQPVSLPAGAFAPFLEGPEFEALQARSEAELAKARQAQTEAQSAVQKLLALQANRAADAALADAESPPPADDFTTLRDDLWIPGAGDWRIVEGHLRQLRVALENSPLVARTPPPPDFRAVFSFRILGGQTYHSVGMSFDVHGEEHASTVYLSAHPPGPKLQASYTRGGQHRYPEEGTRPRPVELNRAYTLEIRVRNRLVNAFVDGEPVLVHRLPEERRPGNFTVWTFDAQAEFLSFQLTPLAAEVLVAETLDEAALAALPPEQAAQRIADAEAAALLARKRLEAAEADRAAFDDRTAADRARYADPPGAEADTLARAAHAAERRAKLLKLEADVLATEQQWTQAQRKAAAAPEDAAAKQGVDESVKALEQARQQLASAREAPETAEYTSIAAPYPRVSTGRRLALARWIIAPENPLAARVAVNHLWGWCFSAPLVENTFDFGLRTPRPRQHELLDWLAVELQAGGWRLKPVIRRIVLSRAYRLASSSPEGDGVRRAGGADDSSPGGVSTSPLLAGPAWRTGQERDPDNRRVWRGAVRRLDAEVVRDAVLACSGGLDTTLGGPDIEFSQGETSPRRSLYFQHAYEKQMLFLTTFDAASPNECYQRKPSIIPQQALAMANSAFVREQARRLAAELWTAAAQAPGDAAGDAEAAFILAAFETVLSRSPSEGERTLCREFLAVQRDTLQAVADSPGPAAAAGSPEQDAARGARENLVHVLFNHNDFVTVR